MFEASMGKKLVGPYFKKKWACWCRTVYQLLRKCRLEDHGLGKVILRPYVKNKLKAKGLGA
jgi:hypothetical protein